MFSLWGVECEMRDVVGGDLMPMDAWCEIHPVDDVDDKNFVRGRPKTGHGDVVNVQHQCGFGDNTGLKVMTQGYLRGSFLFFLVSAEGQQKLSYCLPTQRLHDNNQFILTIGIFSTVDTEA